MKTIKPLSFALLIFVSATSQAFDLGHGFTIKGFGTGGLVNSSNSSADFVANHILQPVGAGFTSDVSLVVDSKLGMQLDYKATDRLSFMAQGLSRQQYDKSFSPVLEWAYVKFKIFSELDIRAGRIRPPVYMLSDYMDVNYANPWVRPPVEFYTSVPLDRMEGVDFLWRPTTGAISWLVQPYFGMTQLGLPGAGNSLKGDKIFGINLSGTYGDLTIRVGFAASDISIVFPNINRGLSALTDICNTGLDQTACDQLNTVGVNQKSTTFSSVGVNWDNDDHFLMGEFGKRNTTSNAIGETTSWYISGGTRIKRFTPYITYSSYHNDSPASFSGDSNNVFNLGLGASVNEIITAILRSNAMDQSTITLGMRYDFMSNWALKAQWDHIQTTTKGGLSGTGGGLFVNQQPGFGNGPTQVDLFSVTLDFAF